MRMLDLFCGRLGWSKAFLARGWECVGVDLVEPPEIPQGFKFVKADATGLLFYCDYFYFDDGCPMHEIDPMGKFDFVCASSPCEEFSVHGMKHFHPNPKYPENGIRLFNHTREICEASGVPYVMENVRAAQQFVGRAVHHCGPFYLWGTGVPAIMPQGIKKNWESFYIDGDGRKRGCGPGRNGKAAEEHRTAGTARAATIPPELANCVAEYAERLLEQVTPFSLRS